MNLDKKSIVFNKKDILLKSDSIKELLDVCPDNKNIIFIKMGNGLYKKINRRCLNKLSNIKHVDITFTLLKQDFNLEETEVLVDKITLYTIEDLIRYVTFDNYYNMGFQEANSLISHERYYTVKTFKVKFKNGDKKKYTINKFREKFLN